MKKYLKFAGLVACVLALVAFILLMATHAVVANGNSGTWVGGTAIIFGSGRAAVLGYEGDVNDVKVIWTALLSWIFILVGMIIVLVAFVLSLLKIKVLEKFSGVLDLVVIGLFLAAGILTFFTALAYAGVNEVDAKDWVLGGGYVVAGILAILAGLTAALPTAAAFMAKRK